MVAVDSRCGVGGGSVGLGWVGLGWVIWVGFGCRAGQTADIYYFFFLFFLFSKLNDNFLTWGSLERRRIAFPICRRRYALSCLQSTSAAPPDGFFFPSLFFFFLLIPIGRRQVLFSTSPKATMPNNTLQDASRARIPSGSQGFGVGNGYE